MKPGTRAWKKIRRTFGDQILLPETGELDRARMGELIFNDSRLRGQLNAITHPEVRREMVKHLLFYMLRGEWTYGKPPHPGVAK